MISISNKVDKIACSQFVMKGHTHFSKITLSAGAIVPNRQWFSNAQAVGTADIDVKDSAKIEGNGSCSIYDDKNDVTTSCKCCCCSNI